MAHIYMHFDFGADEEKAQEARHKLDVWKQAFRLDKKLQYKLDRPEEADEEEDSASNAAAAGETDAEKAKSKSKSKISNPRPDSLQGDQLHRRSTA